MNFKKVIMIVPIICIAVGCIGPFPTNMRFAKINKIEKVLTDKPKGTVFYTGFQYDDPYLKWGNSSDVINNNFLMILDRRIHDKLLSYRFSNDKIEKRRWDIRSDDWLISDFISPSRGCIPIVNRFEKNYSDEIAPSILVFLEKNVDADYYLSVTGYDKEKRTYFMITLFDRNGKKHFCKIYGDAYDSIKTKEIMVHRYDDNIAWVLDSHEKMFNQYAPEINKDLAFIADM